MIYIRHGIYNNDDNEVYYRDGYQHLESRRHFIIPSKFEDLLERKALKFYIKYNIRKVPFVIGCDQEGSRIWAISICHSHFDKFDDRIGEDIVVGRIKRMRGDHKKIFKRGKDIIEIYYNPYKTLPEFIYIDDVAFE